MSEQDRRVERLNRWGAAECRDGQLFVRSEDYDALTQENARLEVVQATAVQLLTNTAADAASLYEERNDLARENERLKAALRKVRAHTSYVNPTLPLLQGLLQSVERITDAVLDSVGR